MTDSESDESSVPPSGFNEEYVSLSDHQAANRMNPFATSQGTSPIHRTSSLRSSDRSSSFSPYEPTDRITFPSSGTDAVPNRPLNSLLDGPDTVAVEETQVRMTLNTATSGTAGFLEMEEEPSRYTRQTEAERVLEEQEDLIDFTTADEAIQTTSGLLLTHRRSYAEKKAEQRASRRGPGSFPASYRPSATRFEVESSPWGLGGDPYGFGRTPSAMMQAKRLLSFAKLWVIFFCVVLVIGTGVLVHTFRRGIETQKSSSNQNSMVTIDEEPPKQILLLPLNNASELARQQREIEAQQQQQQQHQGGRKLLSHLSDLRGEFEEWIVKHNKVYSSHEEKEHRFGIWKQNHFRTIEKNKRHGDCPLMKKPVFGSTFMKDLTTEEFQTQFLTGYNGPNADGHEVKTGRRRKLSQEKQPPVMHAGLNVKRHPSVHQRMLRDWNLSGFKFSTSSCVWYDVSCWMRVIFQEYLYVGAGTMEPKYDKDTYPQSFDWRDYGAVTSVRRQGDCGACWAITAVETIEAAYFIGTGSLLDLSETEVISCTDSCNLCYGGWPQDAYDYVMEHKGIMLANDWSYDGNSLLSLTQSMETDDAQVDGDLFASYISQNCPASGSGDSSGEARYGNIKGYGFATERCVCYSDGSGCDCDNQNEGMAVRNLASYGPATVCLDASVWQDYDGGIITSSSGCSSKFLAMNHCVQVVGYAYNDGSGGDDDEDDERSGSGSGSQDSGSGSQDESGRVGYWIVRNQWSSYWGMNGYAYVAMGENTCGILNDMTQAYM
jgi:Papain family cysteine protease/Cathepsin propeptide inhibitor domain (I29)